MRDQSAEQIEDLRRAPLEWKVASLFTTHIPDPDPAECNDQLKLPFGQVKVPGLQFRFEWAPNSIAFWDNRATQYYAASDYSPHRRVMERVVILGDVPF